MFERPCWHWSIYVPVLHAELDRNVTILSNLVTEAVVKIETLDRCQEDFFNLFQASVSLPPENVKKPMGFLTFTGDIEMEHLPGMG